nr:alanine racemase [Oceanococcus sp. HetDA_MAG_MS8]
MQRRHFLGLCAVGLPAAGWLLRPSDAGAAYSSEFASWNEQLRLHGEGRPRMLLDLNAVDHNLALVLANLGSQDSRKHLRLVVKSLPSIELLEYLMRAAQTERLMVFDLPRLQVITEALPQVDVLMGKPMPVAAVAAYYDGHDSGFDPARQLQWLVDSPQRLQEYLALAKARDLRLSINIELDVGLRRGGVTAGTVLDEMLSVIQAHPKHLVWSGFMGYDAHVVKVPDLIADTSTLFRQAMQAYNAAVAQLKQDFPSLTQNLAADRPCLNTAGSPTFRLHQQETLCNEVAVGSGIVQPTDFDIPSLEGHRPACFIASPVLKQLGALELPGNQQLGALWARWDVNQRRRYFIYGGDWKAKYYQPAGLQPNPLYGRSTNQDLVCSSPATALNVGDHVFLRPTQSERVLAQFGDLFICRGSTHLDQWTTMRV